MYKLYQISISTSIFALLLPLFCQAEQVCAPDKIPASTPIAQFVVNNDGTVTDNRTGLTWKRCAEGLTLNGANCTGSVSNFHWQNALQWAQSLNNSGGFAGKSDWRIPNVKELASIIENQCNYPAINLSLFPDTPATRFWTSSSTADSAAVAANVMFDVGFVGNYPKGPGFAAIRLVRGG